MQPQYSPRLHRVPRKVANEIRRYRLGSGLTQRQVAHELGVRLSTFSSWERGLTCPATRPLLRLAKTLSTMAEGLYPEFYFHAQEREQSKSQAA